MPPTSNSEIEPLRLAVIGAGVMGLRHMKAAMNVPGIVLSTVHDIHADRTENAAREFGASPAKTLEELRGKADAAVIATPTSAHTSSALFCLNAGLHCLVEKPLALSESDCREMIDTAAIKNLVLQVGHSERFNPAVEALWKESIPAAEIRSISARRLNPQVARLIEDDEILDLMVHDLDVVLALKNAPVREVSVRRLGSEHSSAALTFADSSTAIVEASRSSEHKVRDLDVATNEGVVHVEYAERSAWKNLRLNGNSAKFDRRDIPVAKTDPLQEQLKDFADCIRMGRAPRVSGEHALATLKLAWRIQAVAGKTT